MISAFTYNCQGLQSSFRGIQELYSSPDLLFVIMFNNFRILILLKSEEKENQV